MKKSPRALEARFLNFFREQSLSLGEPACVGFSGGPDSTALVALLCAAGAGPLRLIHVDHGIRPAEERAAELELVKAAARRWVLPLSLVRIRPGAVQERARRHGEGLEAAARWYRHRAFSRLMERHGLRSLYLGHTRDDRLETILMRLLGGSGAAGIGGFQARSGRIVRPLIGFSKTELLAYLQALKIAYSIDSSNADEALLRNRLRHTLIPLLEREFPGWARGLELSAEKAAMDEAALAEGAEAIAFARAAEGSWETAAAPFLAAPLAHRLRALSSALGVAAGGGRAPSRLARLALGLLDRGKAYQGGGISLSVRGERICLSRALDFHRVGGYFVVIDEPGAGGARFQAGDLQVLASWEEDASRGGLKEGSFAFPLVVRTRRPGDVLAIRSGNKPLDELFSEWDLNSEQREAVPLVEDREGIVAALGSAQGAKDRYRHREGLPEGGRRLSIAVKGA